MTNQPTDEEKKIAEKANKLFVQFQKKVAKELGVQFKLELVYSKSGIIPTAVWVHNKKKNGKSVKKSSK